MDLAQAITDLEIIARECDGMAWVMLDSHYTDVAKRIRIVATRLKEGE